MRSKLLVIFTVCSSGIVACTLSGHRSASTPRSTTDTPSDGVSDGNVPGAQLTCADTRCSGHGECYTEAARPVCRCDAGYKPIHLACILEGEESITFEEDAPGVNTFQTVDKIQWQDSRGLVRSLYFAKHLPNATFPDGSKGYVTRLVWQPDVEHDPIVVDEGEWMVNSFYNGGFGIVVFHLHWRQLYEDRVNPWVNQSRGATTSKWDGFGFIQQPLFLGPNHMIYRVTFKQYTLMYSPSRMPDPWDRPTVDVTVDYAIFSGLDHFIYTVTVDCTEGHTTENEYFLNDIRAPYASFGAGSDWSGQQGPPDGQSWKDHKRFVTHDMSNWTYEDDGTTVDIPYVWQWVTPGRSGGDAEAGLVLTETYAQKQAGAPFNEGRDASAAVMPEYGTGYHGYAHQMNYYESYGSKKLTFDFPLGAIDGDFGSTSPYQNYSLACLFTKHSERHLERLVQETQRIHDGTLSVQAVTGELLSTGPEGNGNPTMRTYSPPGYNHVYRTWEMNAIDDTVEVRFDLSAGEYKNPVWILHRFGGADTDSVQVTLNGEPLAHGRDVLLSLDDPLDKLYLTVLKRLQGENSIRVAIDRASSE